MTIDCFDEEKPVMGEDINNLRQTGSEGFR
jgi:hypothetical protein